MASSIIRRSAVAAAALLLMSGCTLVDVRRLSSDEFGGRDNNTTGSQLARDYLLEQLTPIAEGLGAGTGNEAYLQHYNSNGNIGTNVLAVIPGSDLADQYVMVGAHYDHLGSACDDPDPSDTICNGATDNATGVAAVLEIARTIADQPTPPRRSVILALWDSEEDGLVGSRWYADHPVVPLAETVTYVNFDIQGANLLPSLRDTSFAVASETGGARLTNAVTAAISGSELDTAMVSSIFGQYRSDYFSFLNKQVPSVFFSDSTGPCYHHTGDEYEIVDFGKLGKQIEIAQALVDDLANAEVAPAFVAGTPLATFDDLVRITEVIHRSEPDWGRFSPADQATVANIEATLDQMVADGPALFDSNDVNTLLGSAATLVDILTKGECDGFLAE